MNISIPFLQQLEYRVRQQIREEEDCAEFWDSQELDRKVDKRMEELANEFFYLLTGKRGG